MNPFRITASTASVAKCHSKSGVHVLVDLLGIEFAQKMFLLKKVFGMRLERIKVWNLSGAIRATR